MKLNKNQTLDFTSKLSDFEIVNKEFIRCKCYMLATGDNANGSDITLEAVQKAMSRGEFYNKPVVAHLYKDEEDNNKWRVGGHDSKWIITNTSIEVVNECIPFGVIPESSNIKLEEVLESDGVTINTYLTCQIILWVGRFNIMDAAYSDDIYFNQSCELSVNDYHYKDNNILAIDDFTFSALCLLNKSSDKSKEVRPCFPSCRVEKLKTFSFDENQFKQNFELMLEKLKQYETDSTATVQDTHETNTQKGAIQMDLNKFVEIFSAINTDADVCKYRLLNVTDTKVFALDMEDYKPYGFNYAVTTEEDTENIVVDFESKAEMSLSATDKITEENFEEFNIKSAIVSEAEKYADAKTAEHTSILETEFNKKIEELKGAYDELSACYAVATKKLDEYEEKEAQAKAEQHEADVKAVFEKYAEKLSKCAEFLVYKAKCNPAEVTINEVNEKLTLMVGKYMMDSQTKKNFSYNPTETKVSDVNKRDTITSRYGNLLDKYIK